ncbi:MAG: HD domain-containing protein [Clostridium cochlearium]|uniref:HD-GYP domain-containing protein n=1 Tax=Clostridium cochlearium TaxID=1494 RepID=UPI00280BEE84|nr:HD domain-containing phosphohydrolase [Clostridium cochlearium]MDU1442711.1 HD domain-containing protein [Clostridium cochlearium]
MDIDLNNVLLSLSIALDLAESSSVCDMGIVENHTNVNYSKHEFIYHSQKTAYIALEIAKDLQLSEHRKKILYVSSLLHDIGAASFLSSSHSSNKFMYKHCVDGSKVLKDFPFFPEVSKIVLFHHENYDGSGCLKLKGENIPLESQIIRLSDLLELIFSPNKPISSQKDYLINYVNNITPKIIAPKVAKSFLKCAKKDYFWLNLKNSFSFNFVLDSISPNLNVNMDLKKFESIAYIFSNIIDSKSVFTAKHSKNISELAYNTAKYLNYSEEKCLKMKIAGLLHDIGKLAIPTKILDKRASLTEEEFYLMKSHVYYTKVILNRINNIEDIAVWASNHHEKLNGKGYVMGYTAKDLDEESRILAVCDIYQALTEERPYKKAFSNEKAFSIINEMGNNNLICKNAINSFKHSIGLNDNI